MTTFTYEITSTNNNKYFFNEIFAQKDGVKRTVRGKRTAHASVKQAVDHAVNCVERLQYKALHPQE